MSDKLWSEKTLDEIQADINRVVELILAPYKGPMPPDLYDPHYGWLIRDGKATDACKRWQEDVDKSFPPA